MKNAGRAVADVACRAVECRRVVVVAGPGNNGGDGFVAARDRRSAANRGACLFRRRATWLRGDAALAAEQWTGPVEVASPAKLGDCDLIIDESVWGRPRSRCRRIAPDDDRRNDAEGVPIIAVDLPVEWNEWRRHGAAVNVTDRYVFRAKTGHTSLPGRLHRGPVEVSDIGIADNVLGRSTRRHSPWPATWSASFPRPELQGHKYTRGRTGRRIRWTVEHRAARLAARGALRAGAGLVTIASSVGVGHQCRREPGSHGPSGRRGCRTGIFSPTNGESHRRGPGGGVGAAMQKRRRQHSQARPPGWSWTPTPDKFRGRTGKGCQRLEAPGSGSCYNPA